MSHIDYLLILPLLLSLLWNARQEYRAANTRDAWALGVCAATLGGAVGLASVLL